MASSLAWLSDKRVLFVIALVICSLALLYFAGAHYGIEFTGGTRIPITLEKPVTKDTMDEIVNTLELRVTKFGLNEVDVEAVGDQQVYVELPLSTDPTYITQVESILKSVGKFEAIIDGQVALTGDDIVAGSITSTPQTTGDTVQWGVSFVIDEAGAKRFADAAYGKGNYPVNLFLDMPEHSAILLNESDIANASLSTSDVRAALEKVANYGNNQIIFIDDTNMTPAKVVSEIEAANITSVVISKNNTELISLLNSSNITINTMDDSDMQPVLISQGSQGLGGLIVDQWNAIGLLSAPTLNPDLATGVSTQQFSIQGAAKGATFQDQETDATNEMNQISSILSGGALPVNIELNSAEVIPPSLGHSFLLYSAIGMICAAIIVLLVIALRYKDLGHLAPMVFVAASQMTILVCFMTAVGTLDLATIAGLFGSLGTSVDYQIVMTDELIGKGHTGGKDEAKRRLQKASYIVTRDVSILVLILLPLMFSNIVEIIGFVTTTLLGSLLGIAITLLTYNAVVDHQYKD